MTTRRLWGSAIDSIVGRLTWADAYNHVHRSSGLLRKQDTRVGSSTGRFDVGTERLVVSPIRGRADELSVIGASVTAADGPGPRGVLVIEGPLGIGKSRLLTEVIYTFRFPVKAR